MIHNNKDYLDSSHYHRYTKDEFLRNEKKRYRNEINIYNNEKSRRMITYIT